MDADGYRAALQSERYVYEAVARARTQRTVIMLGIYGDEFLAALEALAADPNAGPVEVEQTLQIGLQERKIKLAELRQEEQDGLRDHEA